MHTPIIYRTLHSAWPQAKEFLPYYLIKFPKTLFKSIMQAIHIHIPVCMWPIPAFTINSIFPHPEKKFRHQALAICLACVQLCMHVRQTQCVQMQNRLLSLKKTNMSTLAESLTFFSINKTFKIVTLELKLKVAHIF